MSTTRTHSSGTVRPPSQAISGRGGGRGGNRRSSAITRRSRAELTAPRRTGARSPRLRASPGRPRPVLSWSDRRPRARRAGRRRTARARPARRRSRQRSASAAEGPFRPDPATSGAGAPRAWRHGPPGSSRQRRQRQRIVAPPISRIGALKRVGVDQRQLPLLMGQLAGSGRPLA
jgi:hypothetical protein